MGSTRRPPSPVAARLDEISDSKRKDEQRQRRNRRDQQIDERMDQRTDDQQQTRDRAREWTIEIHDGELNV